LLVQHHRSILSAIFFFGNGTWGSPEQGDLSEKRPRVATSALTLTSPGRSYYTAVIWKVTAGRS